MNTSDILQTITPIIEQYVIYITAFAIAIIVIYLSRKKIKHHWLNFKVRRYLGHLGIKQLSDVKWPDGLDHYFTIDRLIMRNDGISILMYMRYPGKIFCADNIEEWTQMIGQRSYPFKNPFSELNYQINALSESVPDIPVNGYVFFDFLSEFPKGHPDRVIHYKEIPKGLKRDKENNAQKNVLAAWEKLLQIKKSLKTQS